MLVADPILCESITLTLHQGHFAHNAEASCPHCQAEMELHQPDIDSPDRVLGTCSHCSQWVLIEYENDQPVRVFELPRSDRQSIRKSNRRQVNASARF